MFRIAERRSSGTHYSRNVQGQPGGSQKRRGSLEDRLLCLGLGSRTRKPMLSCRYEECPTPWVMTRRARRHRVVGSHRRLDLRSVCSGSWSSRSRGDRQWCACRPDRKARHPHTGRCRRLAVSTLEGCLWRKYKSTKERWACLSPRTCRCPRAPGPREGCWSNSSGRHKMTCMKLSRRPLVFGRT